MLLGRRADGKRKSGARRAGACVLLLTVAWPAIASAQQSGSPAGRLRESVALDVDSAVAKKLGTAEEYFAAAQWAQGIGMLRQIVTESGETLIAVAPGRYVNVGQYANALLAAMPPEGRDTYRTEVDATARQWYQQARATGDPQPLLKLTRQAFVSGLGDEALNLLAEWAWERGDFAAARGYWTQLVPLPADPAVREAKTVLRYPDADFEQPAILGRLVLCSIGEGDVERAQRELETLRRLYPQATGHLAGRDGNLAETLASVLQQAQSWSLPPADPDVSTFALNPERNKVLPAAIDVGAPQWSVPLPPPLTRELNRESALADRGPLGSYPVVFGEVVFAGAADAIFAWKLSTGEPAWPGAAVPALVYPPLSDETAPLPSQPVVGTPQYTLTVHEGRLYARMGSPVTGVSSRELRDLQSELVCLDVAQRQGQLLWKVSPADVIETSAGWMFEGAPVVAGSRAYAALRGNHPSPQVNIACFDSGTGRLIWNKKVCSATAGVGVAQNMISHNLLTLADNTLYYATHLGAVAALDATEGTLRWVVTYESRPRKPASRTGKTERGPLPCLFDRGTVFAAPLDSDQLLAIDARTGIVKWTREVSGGVAHLLGVGLGNLIVSGADLWGIDAASGQTAWHVGFSDPAGFGYGRGVLAAQLVYWPTRGELFIVHQGTGAVERRVALSALHKETGGNLTIAGGRLLIAQPDKLVALGEYGKGGQPENRVVEHPRSHTRRIELAGAELPAVEHAARGDVHSRLAPHGVPVLQAVAWISEHHPADIPLPLHRIWEHQAKGPAVALLPAGRPLREASQCVLASGDVLQCIDRASGAARWSAPQAAPVTWAAYFGNRLVLATTHTLRAVALESGAVLWERFDLQPTALDIASSNKCIVCLDRARVPAISADDGSTLWEYAPQSGELQRHWCCDARHIVVQRLSPDRTVVLDVQDGGVVAEVPGFPEPWAAPPTRISADRFALLSARKQIRSFSIATGAQWDYSGPISFASADPALLACNGAAYLIVDGDTLVRLEPATGRPIWSVPFTRSPIRSAGALMCHDAERLYVPAEGMLRCFSLADGALVWEQMLGERSGRWQAVMCGQVVAAHPAQIPNNCHVQLIVVDRQTGERVQQLAFDGDVPQQPVSFDPDRHAPVVCVGNRIVGLGQFPLQSAEPEKQLARQNGR